jgi:hypothetical protein
MQSSVDKFSLASKDRSAGWHEQSGQSSVSVMSIVGDGNNYISYMICWIAQNPPGLLNVS